MVDQAKRFADNVADLLGKQIDLTNDVLDGKADQAWIDESALSHCKGSMRALPRRDRQALLVQFGGDLLFAVFGMLEQRQIHPVGGRLALVDADTGKIAQGIQDSLMDAMLETGLVRGNYE